MPTYFSFSVLLGTQNYTVLQANPTRVFVMSHVVISVECINCVKILLSGASEVEMRVGLDRVTVQEMSYGASLEQTSRLRSLLYHSTNMARDVVCSINPLNAELNSICHLLELLGAHHILHVSGLRVNVDHVGFVMGNVALGQVSLAVSVSFRCGTRTVKGRNKR